MRLFPQPNELQFLVGKELTKVTFYSGEIYFGWWDGGGLSARFAFEHMDEAGRKQTFEGGGTGEPPSLLHRLLQRVVSYVEVEASHLTLGFDDGQRLRFLAEPGRGECGLIQFTDDLADGWIVY